MRFNIQMIYIGQFDDTEYYPEVLANDVVDAFKQVGATIIREEKVIQETDYNPNLLKKRVLIYNDDGTPKFQNGEPVIDSVVVGAEITDSWSEVGFNHKIVKLANGDFIQTRDNKQVRYYVDFSDSLSEFASFASENWIDVRWEFDKSIILFKETTWQHK